MPDDPGVLQKPLNVSLSEPCDLRKIESRKRLTKILTLPQDRKPAQTRLKALQADLLEEPCVIRDWSTPFLIVVDGVERIITTPPAPSDTIRTFLDAPVQESHPL